MITLLQISKYMSIYKMNFDWKDFYIKKEEISEILWNVISANWEMAEIKVLTKHCVVYVMQTPS